MRSGRIREKKSGGRKYDPTPTWIAHSRPRLDWQLLRLLQHFLWWILLSHRHFMALAKTLRSRLLEAALSTPQISSVPWLQFPYSNLPFSENCRYFGCKLTVNGCSGTRMTVILFAVSVLICGSLFLEGIGGWNFKWCNGLRWRYFVSYELIFYFCNFFSLLHNKVLENKHVHFCNVEA